MLNEIRSVLSGTMPIYPTLRQDPMWVGSVLSSRNKIGIKYISSWIPIVCGMQRLQILQEEFNHTHRHHKDKAWIDVNSSSVQDHRLLLTHIVQCSEYIWCDLTTIIMLALLNGTHMMNGKTQNMSKWDQGMVVSYSSSYWSKFPGGVIVACWWGREWVSVLDKHE